MNTKLIELKTNELLEKFGAGNHKPGSGSAAAFQGLLSAKLLRTVLILTCSKRNYQDRHDTFSNFRTEIDVEIYPRLEILFQDDSNQFSKVFDARVKRDRAKASKDYAGLVERARDELITATEIPLEISHNCLRLAEIAIAVFENGFRAARGDSGVALNGALSAVTGCLSVIDLNLLSFGSNEWTAKIRDDVAKLRAQHTSLSAKASSCLELLKSEADQIPDFYKKFDAFRRVVKHSKITSNAEIERLTRQLQGAMWKNRKIIWKDNAPEDPVELLRPELAIKLLGYNYDLHTTLGRHEIDGSLLEVAGQIDNDQKSVSISSQFPPPVRNFTAAHELGHALLHQQPLLHRDRPLDGSSLTGFRDGTERQADKFATYFLMPKNLVVEYFKTIFLTERFHITEDTAFALTYHGARELREKASNKDGFARILASAESYNGNQIHPIAIRFRVSVGAMAIRLDELNLFAWD